MSTSDAGFHGSSFPFSPPNLPKITSTNLIANEESWLNFFQRQFGDAGTELKIKRKFEPTFKDLLPAVHALQTADKNLHPDGEFLKELRTAANKLFMDRRKLRAQIVDSLSQEALSRLNSKGEWKNFQDAVDPDTVALWKFVKDTLLDQGLGPMFQMKAQLLDSWFNLNQGNMSTPQFIAEIIRIKEES